MTALKNNHCDLPEIHEPCERAGGSLVPSWKWTQRREHPAQTPSGSCPWDAPLALQDWSAFPSGSHPAAGTRLHSWSWWLPRGGSGWAEKERAAPCTPAPRPVRSPEGLKEGQPVGLVPGFQTHLGACWGPFRRGRMAARRQPELGRPGPPHSSGDRLLRDVSTKLDAFLGTLTRFHCSKRSVFMTVPCGLATSLSCLSLRPESARFFLTRGNVPRAIKQVCRDQQLMLLREVLVDRTEELALILLCTYQPGIPTGRLTRASLALHPEHRLQDLYGRVCAALTPSCVAGLQDAS